MNMCYTYTEYLNRFIIPNLDRNGTLKHGSFVIKANAHVYGKMYRAKYSKSYDCFIARKNRKVPIEKVILCLHLEQARKPDSTYKVVSKTPYETIFGETFLMDSNNTVKNSKFPATTLTRFNLFTKERCRLENIKKFKENL